MTEDQTEPIEEVEEKEEKRKIRVVEQIDNRLAIQGQAYMKGELKKVLSLAYEIIEFAEPEDLKSFVKEQEDLIAKVKKLLKEREEKEKERIRHEQLKLRLEKIKKLKDELTRLENEFNNALNIKDFTKTNEILENAQNVLSELEDKKVKQHWEDLKKKYIKAKTRKELVEKAEKLIEESIELKQKFLFNDLKLKITNLMKQLEENELTNYLKEIKEIQSDIINTERDYQENLEKLENLAKEVKNLQKEKKFKEAISNCEQIIRVAGLVKREELFKDYSELITKLQNNIRFEELKDSIKILNDEGLILLKKGDIELSLEKFNIIKDTIKKYLE